MSKGRNSRRSVLGAAAGVATVGFSGCLGVLEEQMSDSDEYAVQHRTESEYLVPSEPVTLEPPLTFSMDFYVEGSSGIDILPQWDSEQALSYLVKVRSNANGRLVQVSKIENELSSGESNTLVTDRNENDTFAKETWETVEIDWQTDGTLTVTIQSTGESVGITDTELTGQPFVLKGYRYTGSTTFDNIDIR